MTLSDVLRGVAVDDGFESGEVLRMLLDGSLVLPAFFQDDVHQAVEQGGFGIEAVAQGQCGVFVDVDEIGAGDDHRDLAAQDGLANAEPPKTGCCSVRLQPMTSSERALAVMSSKVLDMA